MAIRIRRPIRTIRLAIETAALALALALASVGRVAATAEAADLGGLSFANSGARTAQPAFLRGLFLLHNFEYADAATAFRSAQTADPGFALAYWGEAMSYNHAVWFEQDAAKARAALARLAPTSAERISKAGTPREQAYMQAVETLYGDGAKNERDLRYADAMAHLHARFPDDVDGTAFYALSLLGTAHEGRDVPTYMRAAALLEEVFPAHRDHPGVLHYLIHAYDDPAHAPLGLRPAKLYGRFAADAPHAMHMTSHIFIALGMWDDVIRSNVEAMRIVNLHRVAAGLAPRGCGHYEEWLLYGYLQKRDEVGADGVIARCRATVAALPAQGPLADTMTFSLAELVTWTALSRGAWPADGAASGDASPDARLLTAYARALLALRQRVPANHEIETMGRALRELRAQPHVEGRPDRSFAAESVMLQQIEALRVIEQGKSDRGIAMLRAAAAAEAAIPVEFGPPTVVKPTAELLGDLLLEARRPAEAAEAYRAALRAYPGRTLSLEGLKKTGAPA